MYEGSIQPCGFKGGNKMVATWITPSDKEPYSRGVEGSRWTYSLLYYKINVCGIGTHLKIASKASKRIR